MNKNDLKIKNVYHYFPYHYNNYHEKETRTHLIFPFHRHGRSFSGTRGSHDRLSTALQASASGNEQRNDINKGKNDDR